MGTLFDLKRKVKKLDNDVIINTAFEKSLPAFIDKNKEQLMEGLDSNNETIKPKYKSSQYAKKKQQMNSRPGLGTPDLRLTGAYYSKIETRLEGNKLITDSTDEKADYPSIDQYENKFGLGGEFANKFIQDTLRPNIHEQITAVVGLKFE